MSEWVDGRVRKIFADRGYGFIDAGMGKDIFFHLRFLDRVKREFIKEGVQVKFQLEHNGDRLRAHRIQLVGQEGV